jgi:nitrite reductase (NO-forming)
MRRSSWHLRAGAVVGSWLLAAVTVGVVGLTHPVTGWLLVHLLLLGAVSNAILIWSTHFAAALLRSPGAGNRRQEATRLAVFNAGALTVVVAMAVNYQVAVVIGAVAVSAAVGWHAIVLLLRTRRALPSRFGTTVRYYVAAGGLLPLGISLGVMMAPDDLPEPLHARLALAHVAINLLGWMGLTVVGTLVTLWPTMLHTRIADTAERASRRALPILIAAVLLIAAGALTGSRLGAEAGIFGYLSGLALAGRPLVEAARRRPPTTYASWSVLAGLIWFVASITALAVIVATAAGWEQAAGVADRLAAPLLVGFAAQILIGALSYLIPVVLAGGPSVARATTGVLETAGVLRIIATNVALLVATLPVPPVAHRLCILLALGALASFLPLAARAAITARQHSRQATSTAG